MGFWEHFPYTNFHEINLEWILGKVKELDSFMRTAKDSVDSNTAAATNAANSAEESANRAEISANLAEAFATPKPKRYIIVGDSYALGYTPEGIITSFADIFKERLGLSDENCYLIKQGGAGFGKVNNVGYNFATALDSLNGVIFPETITDIYVVGGYNDLQALDLIDGGMAEFKRIANSKYPNAKIYIGFVGRNCDTNNNSSILLATARFKWSNQSYFSQIPNICYVLREIGYFSSDYYHPGALGQEMLARALINFAKCGSVTEPLENDYAGVEGFSMSMCGNLVQLNVSQADYTSPTIAGKSLNGSASHDFGLITSGPISTGIGMPFTVPVLVQTTDGLKTGFMRLSVNSARHLIGTPVVYSTDGFATASETGAFTMQLYSAYADALDW